MGNPFSRCLQKPTKDPKADPHIIELRKQEEDYRKRIAECNARVTSLRVARHALRNSPNRNKVVESGYSTEILELNEQIRDHVRNLSLVRLALQGTSQQELVMQSIQTQRLATTVLKKESRSSKGILNQKKKATDALLQSIDEVRDTRQEMRETMEELRQDDVELDRYGEFTDSDEEDDKEYQREEKAVRERQKRAMKKADIAAKRRQLAAEEEEMENVALLDDMPTVPAHMAPSAPPARAVDLQRLALL